MEYKIPLFIINILLTSKFLFRKIYFSKIKIVYISLYNDISY